MMRTAKKPLEVLGYRGILYALSYTRWKRDLRRAAVFTLVEGALTIAVWQGDIAVMLRELSGLLTNVYSSLLGISVAAYAILTTLPGQRKLMQPRAKEPSLYRRANAQCALYVIIQAISLGVAFLINLVASSEEFRPMISQWDKPCELSLWAVAGVLLFSFSYQLTLLVDTMILIFNSTVIDEETIARDLDNDQPNQPNYGDDKGQDDRAPRAGAE